MALIKKISRITKERNQTHGITEATYTVFADGDSKIFQMDTYGSEDRKIKGKVSQSIQLNKDSANELIELLKNEFGL